VIIARARDVAAQARVMQGRAGERSCCGCAVRGCRRLARWPGLSLACERSCSEQLGQPDSRRWHAWRRAAQKATPTWNEWLAADGRERAEAFSRYLAALGEEELAASELERAVTLQR
jgi:hypothetical protein